MFFHNMRTCPNNLQRVDCNECERMRKIYDIFSENLYPLRFGDTFKIQAALINNDQSVLPAEIHSFENYQPLLAACTEYPLRLDDTPEGINKKYEREQQRLQREREEEEKRMEDEEKSPNRCQMERTKREVSAIFRGQPLYNPNHYFNNRRSDWRYYSYYYCRAYTTSI